jgi:DNA-binding MarR family transcriptional regulator
MTDTGSNTHDSKANDFAYGSAPSILLVSDSESGAHDAQLAIAASGARVGAVVALDQAMARLDQQLGVDAIMVELTHDTSPLTESVLDRIDMVATYDRLPTFVSVPLAALDAAAARLKGPHVELLCQPSVADRVGALGLRLGFQRLQLNDVSAEVDPVRLRRLADEVSRIAQALARLTPEANTGLSAVAPPSQVNDMMIGFRAEPILTPLDMDAPRAAEVRTLIRLRRMRDQYFDPHLFADPAWDMLLDLFAARLERAEVAVSSLCIAAAVPPTTALRWIKTMTEAGIFERCADPDDGRRLFIRLADRAADGVTNYLAAAKKLGGFAI